MNSDQKFFIDIYNISIYEDKLDRMWYWNTEAAG